MVYFGSNDGFEIERITERHVSENSSHYEIASPLGHGQQRKDFQMCLSKCPRHISIFKYSGTTSFPED